MKITQYEKDFKKHEKEAISYKLSGDDKKAYDFFKERKEQLQLHRKNLEVEEIWRAADKAYQPNQATGAKKKVLVSDDELGLRSTLQVLNSEDDWMETSVAPNPYVKIQTAIGIIVDRNPGAVLKPGAKKYIANTDLIANLYRKTWSSPRAPSRSTLLKPFVFNQAKYGVGCGRTYPLKITRTVDELVEFKPTGSKYRSVEFEYFNDVFRESLSPWQCWFDDGGIVGNPLSFNDNMWFKDYDWTTFIRVFKNVANFKYVIPSQKILRLDDGGSSDTKSDKGISKFQERVWFYENLELDRLFIVTDGGVVLVNEPLPQKPKNKHLSLYSAPWTLRDDRTVYGIGVYEIMRGNHKLHTKVNQMTMDQLVQSIYKEFFYEGTDTLQGDGQMRVRPGKGRQVTNPQNVRWNEIPGPGLEAWQAIDRIREQIDNDTGITRNLSGEVVGKTAYETAQARESALKRLKTPLDHLTEALVQDAYITVSIVEDLYSVAKIKLIGEDRYVDAMQLEEERDVEGNLPQHEFEYREVSLNLKKNNEGFVQTEEENFIELKPEFLQWEGVIEITGESIIADSELLNRTTTLEMTNVLFPMLQMPSEIAKKPATEILKVYKKDPADWLPDAWMQEQQQLFQPIQQTGQTLPEQTIPEVPRAETVVPRTSLTGITTPSESFSQTL